MSLLDRIISYWLEGIASISILLAVLFSIWRADSGNRYKYVAVYLFLIALFAVEISIHTGKSNSFQYSCIYLLNSLCWSIFFFQLFNTSFKKKLAIGVALITTSYFFYKNVFLEFDLLFDSIGQVLSSTGIVLLIFIYFHQVLSVIKPDSLTQNFDFWISSAQLIYHLGAFGIFLTFNHFTSKIFNTENYSSENRQILASLWGVHNVLLFLASLLTWVGVLWIVYRRKSSSS
jgi:hypothetical protein